MTLATFPHARRWAAGAALCAALAGPALVPSTAHAWWVRGRWYPRVVVVGPPVAYAPPPVAYVRPPFVRPYARWVPGHYNWRGWWVPAHWG